MKVDSRPESGWWPWWEGGGTSGGLKWSGVNEAATAVFLERLHIHPFGRGVGLALDGRWRTRDFNMWFPDGAHDSANCGATGGGGGGERDAGERILRRILTLKLTPKLKLPTVVTHTTDRNELNRC